MNSIVKYSMCFFLVIIVSVFAGACSGPAEIAQVLPEAVCRTIIDTKCVGCHYKTRICDALGIKSLKNWQKTVKYMQKQGAGLTEDEQKKVINCLSSLPAGSDVVCN